MKQLTLRLTLIFLALGCGRSSTPEETIEPDAGVGPTGKEIVCENVVKADDECSVTKGTGTAVALMGDVVGETDVFIDGIVLIENNEIVCSGCDCQTEPAYQNATLVECGGKTISPALINPHDHIRFSEGAPLNLDKGTRYNHRHDWRGSVSTPGNPHGTGTTSAGMRWGELRMLFGGATSMVGSGGATGMVRNLDRLSSEEEAMGLKEVRFETFSLGDAGEDYKENCGWNYKIDERQASEESSFLPHVAEGIDALALEEFKCQSSSFDGAQDFTEKNAAHIHSIGLGADDYYNMARDNTKLIWSARTNIALYGITANASLFDRLGGTLALGTDWSYTGSANMLRELACVDGYNSNYLDGYFDDRQLVDMATINAAIATSTQDKLGSLSPGKLADITIFSGNGSALRRIIEGNNEDVQLVLKDGRPLLGAPVLISAFGEACEDLDVCGAPRQICAEQEWGTTYAAIAAETSEGSQAYPAFFCGTPAGEPTCIPSRPGEFDGITADDQDGDGISDSQDNCPTVFNPIRPIDNGEQPDNDNDGEGDPCDESPLAVDLDNDGTNNEEDNCPFVANSDQVDLDGDQKGDTCDACPEAANPDAVCPVVVSAATVGQLRAGAFNIGDQVTINGLVVTSVFARGATAQDPSITNGQNAGIYLFNGATMPSVAEGDVINVTGEVDIFFDLLELKNLTITITASGMPIAPVELTVAQAQTEAYESVLVKLTDGTVNNLNYDCSIDHSSCADTGLWEIDSSILVYDNLYNEADWDARKGTLPVAGVMHYRFDRRRIMPRSSTDFLP